MVETEALQREIADLRQCKDGAYEERNQVVAALARLFPSGLKQTDIPGWDPEWHCAVYIDLPTGQVSWHYHDSQAHLFAGLPPYTGGWDGHDTPEKYRRLATLYHPDEPGNWLSVRTAAAPWLEARTVCDDPAVITAYTAVPFDDLGQDGREWVSAIVAVAQERERARLTAGRSHEPAHPDSATPSGDGAETSASSEAVKLLDRLEGSVRAHEALAGDPYSHRRVEQLADDIDATRTALLSRITSPSPNTSGRDPSGTGSRASTSWIPQAKDVLEAMQDGGYWRSCTGCHETCEGHETGDYPYSPVYQCYVGSGCHECGGIGVIWEPPFDEAALVRSAQATSRPPASQDLATLSSAACPGEWCGHLLMEMTEADSDFCDALVNAYRSGRLVPRPTPPDLIQAAREGNQEIDHNIHFAVVSILDWMMCEGLMRHRTAEDDGLKIEEIIRSALSFRDRPHPDPATGGEAPGRDDGWVLLPREPTPEMLEAYWHQTGESHAMRPRTEAYAARLYRAMLSASPRSSQKEEGRSALQPQGENDVG